jgi:DNA ligase D-like protein (predicted 3'-phosphoesterase)
MPAKTATRSSLERYHAKRDFSPTDEPQGAAVRPGAVNLRYLIQKHEATRLHYDFRLELDGTLKSCAVTKGPSLDPADPKHNGEGHEEEGRKKAQIFTQFRKRRQR